MSQTRAKKSPARDSACVIVLLVRRYARAGSRTRDPDVLAQPRPRPHERVRMPLSHPGCSAWKGGILRAAGVRRDINEQERREREAKKQRRPLKDVSVSMRPDIGRRAPNESIPARRPMSAKALDSSCLANSASRGPPDAFEGGLQCRFEGNEGVEVPRARLTPRVAGKAIRFCDLVPLNSARFIHQPIHHIHQATRLVV